MWTINQNDAKRAFTHRSVSMWMAPKTWSLLGTLFVDFFTRKLMCDDGDRFSMMLIHRNLKLLTCSTSAPLMLT